MLLSQLNLAKTRASFANSEEPMTCSRSRAVPALGLLFVFAVFSMAANAQETATWAPVEQALGRTGATQPGGVIKFAFPRRDLHVMVGDVAVRPGLALGGWVAFKQTSADAAMVMGDLVLTENEIGPVMSALQHHLLGGVPNTMYLHIVARGNAVTLARAIRHALEASKTPLDTAAAGPPPSF